MRPSRGAVSAALSVLLMSCAKSANPVAAVAPREISRLAVLNVSGSGLSFEWIDLFLDALAAEIEGQKKLQVSAGRALAEAIFGPPQAVGQASKQFEESIGEGQQALERLQLRKARNRLTRAMGHLSLCGARLGDKALVDLYTSFGLAHLYRGEETLAETPFRQAVAFNNALDLSTVLQPAHLEVFERARRQLLSGNPTEVQIRSTPEGAQVFVDGLHRGQAPLALPLYPGRHFVRLELGGHAPWTRNLPDDVPPAELKARLFPTSAQGPNPSLAEDILGFNLGLSDTPRLQEVCKTLSSDALLLLVISEEPTGIRAATQVFYCEPPGLTRPEAVSLGKNAAPTGKRIAELAAGLKSLAAPAPAPAAPKALPPAPESSAPEPSAPEPPALESPTVDKPDGGDRPVAEEAKTGPDTSPAPKKKKKKKKKSARKKRKKKR